MVLPCCKAVQAASLQKGEELPPARRAQLAYQSQRPAEEAWPGGSDAAA